jgi:hypothetical protein
MLFAWFLFLFAGLSLSSHAGLNPASPGLPNVDNVYGLNGVPGGAVSATCVSCHTLVPIPGRSSHFVRRTGGSTVQPAKERLVAWNGSGAKSRYGTFGSPPASVVDVAGELICESCHSLKKNVTGGNNLLESSLPYSPRPAQPNNLSSASTTLCEGCPVSSTLPGHHPMTGDTTSSGAVLTNTDAASSFTRVFVDNANALPYGVSSTSEVVYPGPDRLNCLSCHGNGHTGYTGTGATILRRGWAGAASVSPIVPTSGVVGVDASGLDRQIDHAPLRMITNWQPLCDACHKVDD